MLSPLARSLGPLGMATARQTYLAKLLATTPLAAWPLSEASGSTAADATGNGRSGSYSNVTLGATGIGDGLTAATFGGLTSYVNVYSVSLGTAFNGSEGTVAGWAKVAGAGVWADGQFRQTLRLLLDGSNYLILRKTNAASTFAMQYNAGGTVKTVSTSVSTTAWFHWSMTWSKSVNEMRAYINGSQVGSTQTGLGTWAGGLPPATTQTIGAANTSGDESWSGSLAHVAVWNSALAPATIAALATV